MGSKVDRQAPQATTEVDAGEVVGGSARTVLVKSQNAVSVLLACRYELYPILVGKLPIPLLVLTGSLNAAVSVPIQQTLHQVVGRLGFKILAEQQGAIGRAAGSQHETI